MKISNYDVTEIKHDSAKVGCTTVTREEVIALLDEMSKASNKYQSVLTLVNEYLTTKRNDLEDAVRQILQVMITAQGNVKELEDDINVLRLQLEAGQVKKTDEQ